MNGTRLLHALCLTIILPFGAQAADVFGNGNRSSNANTGGNTFNANNAWAVPFTTGASNLADRTLQGAWVLVGGETNPVTFSVSIYDDLGTLQGPTGSPLASGSMSIGAGDPIAWRFVTFSSQVVLAGSDNFYVSVSESVPSTNFRWAYPTSPTTYSNLLSGSSYAITGGNEAAANVWRRSGTDWANSGFTVAANPFGVQLVSVPEPSTYLLAAIATAVVFASRRTRRQMA